MPSTLPRLAVRDALGNLHEIEVSNTPFTMGRQGDNDLVLLDSRISRRHARILQDGGGYFIEDAGSRHGTYVNRERIQSCRLKSGDQISLGVADTYTISFFLDQAILPELLEKLGRAAESPAPQLQHLGLLLQMAQMMHRAPALEEVLATLVDSSLGLANAERGLLFLRDEKGGLPLRLARHRGGTYLSTDMTDYSRQVVERVAKTGLEEVLLEEEVTGQAAQETAVIRAGVRGIVALPLQKHPLTEVTGETIQRTAPELMGVLYLDTRSHPTAVTGLDRQVLQALALEGATVIENARLFRVAREQERIQHEFSLARRIQQGLLPRELPQSDYFQLQAVTMPSETVGGDYYDVVQLPNGRYGFAVADVSGKGLPGAMLAANLQGAFAAVAAGDPEICELFQRVNEFLVERTPSEMYATVLYGVLAPDGNFNFISAGHVPPLIVRGDGTVESVASSNFPMGLFARATFDETRARLAAGDMVVICSDGVTEARVPEGELFGEARLVAALRPCAGKSAEEACERVVGAVQEFVGSAPQADDLTLVVLRYGPS
jgi:serine phosphatase RsbU (regulator of sigma subunit)